MSSLSEKSCKPCEGGIPPLDLQQAEEMLQQLGGAWSLEGNRAIHRDFDFKNFYETMAFVNAIAWIANQEGHHPDLTVAYNHCGVTFTTHAIGGLSENDFICAAKINNLGTL
jgi:4a-hydroxytetrahydrobiopterin dehydratase